MGRKKKTKNTRPRKKREPISKMDRLYLDKMAGGFKLMRTTDPKDFKQDDPAWAIVTDGLLGSESHGIALAVVVNAVLTQKRVFFTLFTEDFAKLLKYDAGLKARGRRTKERVIKEVIYNQMRAFLHKSGYFRESLRETSSEGHEIPVLEVIDEQLLTFLASKNVNAAEQKQEIVDFYQNSRAKLAKKREIDADNERRKAASEQRKKGREEETSNTAINPQSLT